MTSSAAFRVAGEVFETARQKGHPLEAAMREADRTLRAAQQAARVPSEATGPIPAFAQAVLEQVAHHYRVTVEAMQFRGGRLILADARDEVSYILLRAGLSHTQVGRLMRRDRYVAIASERRFVQVLALGPVPRARVESMIDRLLALKAYQEAPPPRRPPLKAPKAEPATSTAEGSA